MLLLDYEFQPARLARSAVADRRYSLRPAR
jgi:hypothetical protein